MFESEMVLPTLRPIMLVALSPVEGHCDPVLILASPVPPLTMQGPVWLFMVFTFPGVAVR